MSDEDLFSTIRDGAYTVRTNLFAGYLESVYRNALRYELEQRGLTVAEEVPLHVVYKGYEVGLFRADLIVEGRVIIELKAVDNLLPVHELQLVNYLKTTGIDHGFLINYGAPRFRIIYKSREYKP